MHCFEWTSNLFSFVVSEQKANEAKKEIMCFSYFGAFHSKDLLQTELVVRAKWQEGKLIFQDN